MIHLGTPSISLNLTTIDWLWMSVAGVGVLASYFYRQWQQEKKLRMQLEERLDDKAVR